LIFENHNTINDLLSTPEKDNLLSELPINSLENGYNIEVVERQAIEKKTASNQEITISTTLAKLLNEDAMIQIEDKVYRFTRNSLFQTSADNAEKLKNIDYLNDIIISMKSNKNLKASVSSTYSQDDINVSPIQRGVTTNSNSEGPCDEIGYDENDPCDPIVGPGGGAPGGVGSTPCVEIDEDLNPGGNSYVHNYNYEKRGSFSSNFETSNVKVTAIAVTENLRRKNIILFPDGWDPEYANYINANTSSITLRRSIPNDPYSSEDVVVFNTLPDMSNGGRADTSYYKHELNHWVDTGFEWRTRFIESYHYIEEDRNCLYKVTRVSRNDEVQSINFSY